jgi:hypothetical protein
VAKISIHIGRENGSCVATASCDASPEWRPNRRVLRRGDPNGMPLPPLDEEPGWSAANSALWRNASDKALSSLFEAVLGDPPADGVTRFGEYLFATLLGRFWGEIEELDGKGAHDIRLSTSKEATALQGLPWEMMSLANAPLIADPRGHSLARVVDGEPVGPSHLEMPLRVLFVVAQSDEDLRPGAEYFSILRSLDARVTNSIVQPLTTLINVRTIADVTATRLQSAMASFRPDIVHIVAHGLMVGNEPAIVLTAEAGGANIDTCTADRLVGLLRGNQAGASLPLPPLVIVNACGSADQPPDGNPLSIAASLVSNGVAAAIGMAGEVASSACRLFTKAFYGGLAAQLPLERAVALGQQAARLHYERFKQSAEWARPALFVARGATFEFTLDAERRTLIERAASLRGKDRGLCDRDTALRAYQHFIETACTSNATSILAFEQLTNGAPLPISDEVELGYRLGKTWLLQELRWRALLDHYLPCLIPNNKASPAPTNLALFALRLSQEMDTVRQAFGMPPRHTSLAQQLVFSRLGQEAIQYSPQSIVQFQNALATVKRILAAPDCDGVGLPGVDASNLGQLIAMDIDTLCGDIRTEKQISVRGVLVLIDDLHQHATHYSELLALATEFGLGTKDSPAPIVVTYGPGNVALIRSALCIGGTNRASVSRLEPFSADFEWRAAYSQYMLFSHRRAPRRGVGAIARKEFTTALDAMHDVVRGVPSFLAVYRHVLPVDPNLVVPAEDEAIFAQMVKDNG